MLTTLVQSVTRFLRLMATDTPARFPHSQAASARISGPAPNIAPTRNGDGLAQLAARRKELREQAERLRNLRRSREASLAEAELRAVNHAILARRKNFPEGLPK